MFDIDQDKMIAMTKLTPPPNMTADELGQLVGGLYIQIEIQFDDNNQVASTQVEYDLPQQCVDIYNYTS